MTIPRGRMNQFSLETKVEIFVLIWHQKKVEKSKIIDDLVFFERRFLWEIETHCRGNDDRFLETGNNLRAAAI